MKGWRRWRSFAKNVALFNAALNLLLFALNPAWASIVWAWLAMLVAASLIGSSLIDERRSKAAVQRHTWLFPPPSMSDVPPRSVVVLGPGERVIPIPQIGGSRKPQVPMRKPCTHWPRDEVKLSDGSVAAYICRRCDHDWANEDWVRS